MRTGPIEGLFAQGDRRLVQKARSRGGHRAAAAHPVASGPRRAAGAGTGAGRGCPPAGGSASTRPTGCAPPGRRRRSPSRYRPRQESCASGHCRAGSWAAINFSHDRHHCYSFVLCQGPMAKAGSQLKEVAMFLIRRMLARRQVQAGYRPDVAARRRPLAGRYRADPRRGQRACCASPPDGHALRRAASVFCARRRASPGPRCSARRWPGACGCRRRAGPSSSARISRRSAFSNTTPTPGTSGRRNASCGSGSAVT